MTEEFLHYREHACIIGGCHKNHLVISERVLDDLSDILSCKVTYNYLRSTLLCEHFTKLLGCLSCVAVNRCVSYKHALILGLIGRPCVVYSEIVFKVFGESRSVKREYGFDLSTCKLFENVLHLHTVLSDNVEIITSCLASPAVIVLCIESSELAESVSREKKLLALLIGEHNLRPVNHRRKNKFQCVASEGECVALLDCDCPARKVSDLKELTHKLEGLSVADRDNVGVLFYQSHKASCVVGLHVRDNYIVGLFAVKGLLEVIKPLGCFSSVRRIHYSYLLIENNIGIISHTLGNFVLALKQVNVIVIDAYVANCFGNIVFIHFMTSVTLIWYLYFTI